MTLRILHKRNLPRSKPARAIRYAAERWEPYVHAGFYRAIRAAQREFNADHVRAALQRGAPEIAVQMMPWAEFERALERHLLPAIRNAVMDGGGAAVTGLPKSVTRGVTKADPDPDPKKKPPERFQVGADVSFDLRNPRTERWLAQYGSRLVTRVKDETRLAIRAITVQAQQQGLDVRQQADKITRELKRDMGLNQRGAKALANYEAGLIEQGLAQTQVNRQVAEYRDRLIDQRSRVIAQHETLTASAHGQSELWRQAQEQGLLPADQQEKWIAQPGLNANNPCPVCQGLNGQVRRLGEPFVSEYDGTVVQHGEQAHVGCRCNRVLHLED